MNKYLYHILMSIGLFLFVLGLFDLTETKFGWTSITSLLGFCILWITLLYNKIDKLEKSLWW